MVIRVRLPAHLRKLAQVTDEVELELEAPVTVAAVLDALETVYPVLRGTIRERGTLERRAFVRYFAGEQDVSHDPPDAPLPAAVAAGQEPFHVVGALAGG
ncbi:MAG TPA: MoaD/ThiS family protein [Nitriliruptorales bacterium]